jgi:hypothetical protein
MCYEYRNDRGIDSALQDAYLAAHNADLGGMTFDLLKFRASAIKLRGNIAYFADPGALLVGTPGGQ